MSGDPSRRPSNTRVRLPAIDRLVTIACRFCLGDGWWRPRGSRATCPCCTGTKRQIVTAIEVQPSDIVKEDPRI